MRHDSLPRVVRRAIGFIRYARGRVDASAASLFLVDTHERALHGLMSEWDWTRTSFSSNLNDWPTVERALIDGNLVVMSAEGARGAEAAWFEPRGISKAVCVPLRVVDRAIGVLFFDFAAGQELRTNDVGFLADVGTRCARAFARSPEAARIEEDQPSL